MIGPFRYFLYCRLRISNFDCIFHTDTNACNTLEKKNHILYTTRALTGIGSLVRSFPTLFLTKLQRLKETLGLGGMAVLLTARVGSVFTEKLADTFENFW